MGGEKGNGKAVTRGLTQHQLQGMSIVAAGGRIVRVTDKLFQVKSANLKGQNQVRWTAGRWACDCGDYQTSRRPCMHVHAVDFLLRLPEVVLANQRGLKRECPYCGSNEVISKGSRYNKSGSVPLKLCQACGRKFGESTATGVTNTALAITSVDLFYRGLSLRQIRAHLSQVYGLTRAASTIHEWILKVTALLVRAAGQFRPKSAGATWHADEMKIRVDGQWRYVWNVLDSDSRALVVSMVTEGRGAKEALAVLKTAIARTGAAPKVLSTDGLKSYTVAVTQSRQKMIHRASVKFKDPQNNNKIESFHSTLRDWTRVKRGMKKHTPELMEGRRIFYNNLRPHSSLGGKAPSGKPPARWVDFLGDARSPPHAGSHASRDRDRKGPVPMAVP